MKKGVSSLGMLIGLVIAGLLIVVAYQIVTKSGWIGSQIAESTECASFAGGQCALDCSDLDGDYSPSGKKGSYACPEEQYCCRTLAVV